MLFLNMSHLYTSTKCKNPQNYETIVVCGLLIKGFYCLETKSIFRRYKLFLNEHTHIVCLLSPQDVFNTDNHQLWLFGFPLKDVLPQFYGHLSLLKEHTRFSFGPFYSCGMQYHSHRKSLSKP